MRGFIICLFLVFYVSPGTFAQVQKSVFIPLLKNIEYKSNDPIAYTIPNSSISAQMIPRFSLLTKNLFPMNFYALNMGTVCKIELKMQKQIKFPLFIRMGNKDYVDRMEGKFSPQR